MTNGSLGDAGTYILNIAGSFVFLLGSFALGCWLHSRFFKGHKAAQLEQGQEGLIVSSILLVLGLLLGFTFSLALSRFEQRRMLVITEANAIGTSYLRAQLLDEPDRTRLSKLLVAYTGNRIELANASSPEKRKPLLDENDRLLTDIWAGVSAAVETPKGRAIGMSLLLTFNDLIDHDTERKSARISSIPTIIIVAQYLFLVVTAAVVGFVLSGARQRALAAIMLTLFALVITIIADLNDPTTGTIVESQQPMLMTRDLLAEPRAKFDEYKLVPGPRPASN